MKVILYMAMTVNGIVAKENDDTTWVTETEWKSFSGTVKKIGNMVIGRRTYEIMLKNDEFNKSGLTKIKTVVLTRASLKIHDPKFVFTVQSPKQALEILLNQGFRKMLVCGGGGLNSSFMKEGLIDEIYLDVEPIIFGKGIRLFEDSNFESNLQLIGSKKLSKNEIQLHYRVKKV